MILPQSEAFDTLHRRLTAIPPSFNPVSRTKNVLREEDFIKHNIDFKRLLNHFIGVQERHKEQKHKLKINMLTDRESTFTDIL